MAAIQDGWRSGGRLSPVDVPGHSGVFEERAHRRTSPKERAGRIALYEAFPSGLPERSFPRKEVIQPHLPVRLPCYDFTPVTSPTFDGSLPEGLGHRLRVLLTPVV